MSLGGDKSPSTSAASTNVRRRGGLWSVSNPGDGCPVNVASFGEEYDLIIILLLLLLGYSRGSTFAGFVARPADPGCVSLLSPPALLSGLARLSVVLGGSVGPGLFMDQNYFRDAGSDV